MKGNPFWNQQIPASSLDEARVAAPCPLCPSVSRGPAHKPQQGAWAVAAPGGRAAGAALHRSDSLTCVQSPCLIMTDREAQTEEYSTTHLKSPLQDCQSYENQVKVKRLSQIET